MAIQTKAQLLASNNTAFPDNTEGLITPSILRGFNTASIDSYAALSGSNTFVGNQIITGSVTATSFTGSFLGNLVGTASWANNATTSSHALTAVSASYALNATSASYASNATSASYAVNATSASYASTASFVQNAQTASFVLNAVSASFSNFAVSASYASASTSASYAATASFVQNAVSSSYASNATSASYALTSTSASYASASTSASYALVAESANTIGNSTINGIQTYTYSQNGLFKLTHKFVTGSFNIVSGSWTKIMTINSSTSSWRGTGTIIGSTNTVSQEFGIGGWGVVFRQANTTIFGQQAGFTTANLASATNAIAVPEFSGSASGSTGIDIFARNAYNVTSSLLIDCVFNYTSGSFTYTFY